MISVWSPLIRIFHWSLATIVISNLWLNEEGETWHNRLGYTAVALIFFRFLYGFYGPIYSRWTTFLKSPRETFKYSFSILKNKDARTISHNPAAAYGMVLMLILVMGLGLTGYLLEETDRFFGDENMQGLHELLANVLIGAVILHLTGIFLHIFRHKENIVTAMITGQKKGL